MLNLLDIPDNLILRQAATWLIIPTRFQRKVYSTLQPLGWFPMLILSLIRLSGV